MLLLTDVLSSDSMSVIFAWIPGHAGNNGVEGVDHTVKKALTFIKITSCVSPPPPEILKSTTTDYSFTLVKRLVATENNKV